MCVALNLPFCPNSGWAKGFPPVAGIYLDALQGLPLARKFFSLAGGREGGRDGAATGQDKCLALLDHGAATNLAFRGLAWDQILF